MPGSGPVTILGIDPGLTVTGYGIVVAEGSSHTAVGFGAIRPPKDAPLPERLMRIHEGLLDIIAESSKHDVEFMWYSPTPMCLFNPIVHGLGNKGCSACDGLLSVGANGDVIPCASYDESVGNILESEVLDVWHSERAKLFRDKFLAHPECKSCEHFKICNGACPLYWRTMGFDELCSARGFQPVAMEHFER